MYPMQSLAVIAPIIFIILMIAFPIIGFFMGWKRALFWGAGNFIFYIIGLVIWILAGKAMGEAIGPLLQKSISALKNADMSKIATSVVAPVFFIIVMFFGNIILIINYFAWFTRVAQIRREDKERIGPEPIGKPIAWDNFFRRMIGAISLPALLLPSTFSFTQAIFYATTSKATRAKNKLANNLYNGLNNANNTFKWLSYYKDAPADFDALWAGLSLTKITIQFDGGEKSLEDAVSTTFKDGYNNIYEAAQKFGSGTITEQDKRDLTSSVNGMIDNWNNIVDQAKDNVSPIFASTNATNLLKNILDIGEDPVKVNKDTFDKIYSDDGELAKALDIYKEGGSYGGMEFKKFETIDVPQQSLNNIVDTMMTYYDTSELEPEQIPQLKNRVADLCGFLFKAK